VNGLEELKALDSADMAVTPHPPLPFPTSHTPVPCLLYYIGERAGDQMQLPVLMVNGVRTNARDP
jgi:hypothetical protein